VVLPTHEPHTCRRPSRSSTLRGGQVALFDPPRKIPDPKGLLGEVPDPVRTDLAVLVAVDQLAASVQDEQMRSYLVDTVDEIAVALSRRLPDGAVLTRIG
jgi:hypothetical protein